MRRRHGWGRWFEPAPKQPVPEDGLRVDRFGTTWWGAQWIQALSRLGGGYSNRLPRGRSYARAGRVIDLAMGAGEVTAGVVGTRSRPYEVSIRLKPFAQKQWKEVIGLLAGQARFTIALLRGELPSRAGEALEAQGLGLFPTGHDMETSCSCPDWANPCKHVAAVHYVVAAALDMDPFLIFVLRGLGRESLLTALARARGMDLAPRRQPAEAPVKESPWEAPETMTEAEFLGQGLPRPRLAFRVAPAPVDLTGLARLGPPPPALDDLPRQLSRGIRKASRAAVALAAAGADSAKGTSTTSAGNNAPQDDAGIQASVLAFLRQHPEGAPLTLLRSQVRLATKDLRRILRQLLKEGLLVTLGEGTAIHFAIAADVEEAAAAGKPVSPQPERRRKTAARRTVRSTKRKKTGEPLTDAILAVMTPPGKPYTLREIAALLDRPVDPALRAAMRTLRAKGKVTMKGNRRSARYLRTRRR